MNCAFRRFKVLVKVCEISNTLILLLLGLTSKAIYVKYSIIIQSFDMAFAGATFLFMLFRKDGKGIHDIISGTKVCKIEVGENIKEAEYIENEVKEETPKKIAKNSIVKKEKKWK